MTGVVLLDGGMGQELVARSSAPPHPLWSAEVLRSEPHIVRAVHEDFIRAGARIVTLNAYSVTEPRLGRNDMGHAFDALQSAACRVAEEARARAGGEGVRIAGCLPPLTGSYRPDETPPYPESLSQYRRIVAAQAPHVDLFIAETMGSAVEARAAATAAAETGLPVWVAWVLNEGGDAHLRSGETVLEAARALDGLGVEAAMVNCCPPESVDAALPELRALGMPWGAYPNGFVTVAPLADRTSPTVRALSARQDLTPEAFAARAMAWVEAGASIVGGCCEIGPAHIAALHQRLAGAGHEILAELPG